MTISNILVPVSGIPADGEAIRLACLMARQEKAHVVLMHVIEIQRNLPLDIEDGARTERAESILEQAEKIARSVRGSVETAMLQARGAGSALVDEALERKTDLVIVGVPYRKPLGEFRLGSTTLYVLNNAPCRVWLCRELPSESREDGLKPGKK